MESKKQQQKSPISPKHKILISDELKQDHQFGIIGSHIDRETISIYESEMINNSRDANINHKYYYLKESQYGRRISSRPDSDSDQNDSPLRQKEREQERYTEDQIEKIFTMMSLKRTEESKQRLIKNLPSIMGNSKPQQSQILYFNQTSLANLKKAAEQREDTNFQSFKDLIISNKTQFINKIDQKFNETSRERAVTEFLTKQNMPSLKAYNKTDSKQLFDTFNDVKVTPFDEMRSLIKINRESFQQLNKQAATERKTNNLESFQLYQLREQTINNSPTKVMRQRSLTKEDKSHFKNSELERIKKFFGQTETITGLEGITASHSSSSQKAIKFKDQILKTKTKNGDKSTEEVSQEILPNHDLAEWRRENLRINAKFNLLKKSIWKPQGRIGAAFVRYLDVLLLIGGRGSEIYEEISIFNLRNHKWSSVLPGGEKRFWDNLLGSEFEQATRNSQWVLNPTFQMKKLKLNNPDMEKASSIEHTDSVYNHTTEIADGVIYSFGGEQYFNYKMKMRDCVDELKILDLKKPEIDWEIVKFNRHIIQPRRNHTALRLSKYMLIMGGIDSQGNYLNDMICLQLDSRKWFTIIPNKLTQNALDSLQTNLKTMASSKGLVSEPQIPSTPLNFVRREAEGEEKKQQNQSPHQKNNNNINNLNNLNNNLHNLLNNEFFYNGIAKHCWANVNFSSSEASNIALFKQMPGSNAPNSHNRVISNFNLHSQKDEGIYLFGGEDQNGTLIEGLYQMRLAKAKLSWKKVEKTSGVTPKGRTGACFNYWRKFNLLVLFGGQDQSEMEFFDSIFTFDLQLKEWREVIVDEVVPRTSFASAFVEDVLFIFGGINHGGYTDSVISAIEISNEGQYSVNVQAKDLVRENNQYGIQQYFRDQHQIPFQNVAPQQTFLPLPLSYTTNYTKKEFFNF